MSIISQRMAYLNGLKTDYTTVRAVALRAFELIACGSAPSTEEFDQLTNFTMDVIARRPDLDTDECRRLAVAIRAILPTAGDLRYGRPDIV